jgi:DNA-binding transcriptional MocR family regulator
MSLQRRTQLVHLARKHNALIITDDVYDHLQWPTSPLSRSTSPPHALLPRLTDIDLALPPYPSDPKHFHHTLSNASFSKILGPGVRTGWADASPVLSYGLSQCGSSRSGGCPSQLVATMIAQLLQDGSLEEHIRCVLIPAYARRWKMTMEAIERHLVPLGVSVPKVSLEGKDMFGGYFMWFELPDGVTAERVAVRAKERENLIVAQGDMFEVYGDEQAVRFERWVRVCFAWEEEELMVEGIERLGRVVRDVLSGVVGEGEKSGRNGENLRMPMGSF